ncbi:MAG: FecR family protein [Campylobacterota bacterium]|nr:FecR family protein [Campylobacterota bacterium]
MVSTKNLHRFLLFSLLSLFLFTQTAYSKGKVQRVQGEVLLTHKGKEKKAKRGDTLYDQDTIQTHNHSKILFILEDGTSIQLGSNTLFTVEEDSFNAKKQNVSLRLKEGFLRFITGKIGKIAPQRFKLETSTATIGIRGTDVALFQKNNRFGLLYLGQGKGVVVQGEEHQVTLLDAKGEGVFMQSRQVTPQKELWNYAQSHELVQKIAFKGDLIDQTINFSNQWQWHNDFRIFLPLLNEKVAQEHELINRFSFRTPSWHSVFIEGELSAVKMFYNTEPKTRSFLIWSKASLGYEDKNFHLSLGRIEAKTPWTGSSSNPVTFDIDTLLDHWDNTRDAYGWWWNAPATFEGAEFLYQGSEYARVYASVISKMRHPTSEDFIPLGESLFGENLSNGSDKTKLTTLGVTLLPSYTFKLQGWWYRLSDAFDTLYFESEYLYKKDAHLFIIAGQALIQQERSKLEQNIGGSLFGLRLGYTYKGFESVLNMTKTKQHTKGQINTILTPFEGTPAFTDSFVLRNRNTALPQNVLKSDGAYGAGTTAKQLMIGYDLNYLNSNRLKGFKLYGTYSNYAKQNFPNHATSYDLEVDYTPPREEKFHLNFRINHVKNSDFISKNQRFIRLLLGYRF